MKEAVVEVKTRIVIRYNPKSLEFQKALEAYKEMNSASMDDNDLLEFIAWHRAMFPNNKYVNTIGCVSIEGDKGISPEDWIGVDVDDEEIDFETEVVNA